MAEWKNYYFIGIGGIGMSALARYFHRQGHSVSGYDATPSALTDALEKEGIAIHFDPRPEAIPGDPSTTLVIYTPAVGEEFAELKRAREKGFTVEKRAYALGQTAAGKKCLAVAGTHGKTTTSTLLAHILTHSGEGCNAFLGGISKNYDTNMLISEAPVAVAEADEYDRSFLQLSPEIAAITSASPDHLDIYGTPGAMLEAFGEFAARVSGALVVKKGVDIPLGKCRGRIYSYGMGEGDFAAINVATSAEGRFTFDLKHPGGVIEGCSVGIPGKINIENGIAASAAALLHGIRPEAVREALSAFKGVRRRFDIRFESPRHAYIDDYAHHPEELEASIGAIRDRFPGRHITGIFQPHLFTRTRDFRDGFAHALSLLDRLILLPIYPAREEPIEGVTSQIIFERATLADKLLIEKNRLMETLAEGDTDVIATLGAGDIDRFAEPIENWMKTL